MRTYTIGEHLAQFTPAFKQPREVATIARWAIDLAKQGNWLATREWGGDVVSVAHVVEHLKLGVFIPSTDPWAPLEI